MVFSGGDNAIWMARRIEKVALLSLCLFCSSNIRQKRRAARRRTGTLDEWTNEQLFPSGTYYESVPTLTLRNDATCKKVQRAFTPKCLHEFLYAKRKQTIFLLSLKYFPNNFSVNCISVVKLDKNKCKNKRLVTLICNNYKKGFKFLL